MSATWQKISWNEFESILADIAKQIGAKDISVITMTAHSVDALLDTME